MTKILFEQDYITELYGHEREEKGRKEEGIKEGVLNSIRNLMQNLKFTLAESMNALSIPKEEQSVYIELFENSEKKEVKV